MVPAMFAAPIENPLPRKSRQCDSKMRSISEQSFRCSGELALSMAKMIEEGCVMRKCTHFRNQFAKIKDKCHDCRVGGQKSQGFYGNCVTL